MIIPGWSITIKMLHGEIIYGTSKIDEAPKQVKKEVTKHCPLAKTHELPTNLM